MRYITEIDLRDEFRQKPFKSYQLADNDRLTSEAKHFLEDRKIEIIVAEADDETQIDKEVLVKRDCNTFIIASQLMYLEVLETILLAKDSHPEMCEDLYSMSLVIKQLTDSKKEPEILLANHEGVTNPHHEAITLTQLFSPVGELLVKLFQLTINLKCFKEENNQCLNTEQSSQLDIIDLRISYLIAQLIGE